METWVTHLSLWGMWRTGTLPSHWHKPHHPKTQVKYYAVCASEIERDGEGIACMNGVSRLNA
jgi:hypothetical protein